MVIALYAPQAAGAWGAIGRWAVIGLTKQQHETSCKRSLQKTKVFSWCEKKLKNDFIPSLETFESKKFSLLLVFEGLVFEKKLKNLTSRTPIPFNYIGK